MKRSVCLVAAAALLSGTGCGLEGPLINLATRDRSTVLPRAADVVVTGMVKDAPDGTPVRVVSASGDKMQETAGKVESGAFALRFPGNTGFTALRLDVRWKGGQYLAVIPEVVRQASVMDPEMWIDLGVDTPGMSPMSSWSTTVTLLLAADRLDRSMPFSSLTPQVIRDVSAKLAALKDAGDKDVLALETIVSTLSAAAGAFGAYPFNPAPLADAGLAGLLDQAFLEKSGVEVGTDEFAAALEAALGRVDVVSCTAVDRIRVVFLADMRQGAQDGNCNPVDPFKWASDGADKTMFFTGGIHETTPVCDKDGTPPACLDEDEIDTATQVLGNWVPNVVPMHDDGTQGDAVKGDGVYTLVMDLPYFPVDPEGVQRGVRIGYKYTWGVPGDGWTGTEEWPGNQRLLELVDVNGDGMVVRMDVFGDEASNKDKANQLSPENGGCGVNFWEDEKRDGCAHDTRERRVDTDGDCEPDAWPAGGTASPITGECG